MSLKGFLACCVGTFIDLVCCFLETLDGEFFDFVCRLLAALICFLAGVIRTSLIIACVALCRLFVANGKAEISSDVLLADVVSLFDISKKVNRIRMQANRQIIAAKAINLRANKAPFRIDEIIIFLEFLLIRREEFALY